ncbi:MAG: helix-turn-helix domain-containing protein [bacterium]|nr:helix-turn-helix domain-containing protein [bacterium]
MPSSDRDRFLREIMHTALESGDTRRILSLFREWSGVDVAYIDARTKAICCTRGEPQFYEELQLYPLMELLRIYAAREVTRRSHKLGWLVAASPAGEEFPFSSEAAFVVDALAVCHLGDSARGALSGGEEESSFIAKLFAARREDEAYCLGVLKGVGVELPQGFYAASFFSELDGGEEAKLLERFRGLAESVGARFFVCENEGVKSFLLFHNGRGTLQTITTNLITLWEHSAREGQISAAGRLCWGWSGGGRSYGEIPRCLSQALFTMKHGLIHRTVPPVLRWEELGLWRIFAALSESAEFRAYAAGLLKEIIKYDETHQSRLMMTLHTFVRHSWNLTAVSKELWLHYNSMKYRYNKIAALLGENLDDPEVRFKMTVAVYLYAYSLTPPAYLETTCDSIK